jgi:hypothetical protein
MTSSTTTTAADGGEVRGKPPELAHGLAVLRQLEAQGLIRVVDYALYETEALTRQISQILDRTPDEDLPAGQLQRILLEALSCLETADHYLRMLDGVLDPGEPDEPVPYTLGG